MWNKHLKTDSLWLHCHTGQLQESKKDARSTSALKPLTCCLQPWEINYIQMYNIHPSAKESGPGARRYLGHCPPRQTLRPALRSKHKSQNVLSLISKVSFSPASPKVTEGREQKQQMTGPSHHILMRFWGGGTLPLLLPSSTVSFLFLLWVVAHCVDSLVNRQRRDMSTCPSAL